MNKGGQSNGGRGNNMRKSNTLTGSGARVRVLPLDNCGDGELEVGPVGPRPVDYIGDERQTLGSDKVLCLGFFFLSL